MFAVASGARKRARPLLPLRILIVEDEVGARTALELLLSDLSFTCEVADNGAHALEKHFARPFDLILSDWVMPNGDGMELCRLVRELDGAERYTFFMLLTAHGDKQHLIAGLRGGADAFVRKPIDFDELEAHVVAAERVIRLHRRLAAKTRRLRKSRS
jgi:phosphoserine phosphatase RsbU/P